MARIVQTGDTPAKRRQRHERAAADALRRLATKADLDDAEARDLAAFLALHLDGLYATLDESAHVWDERGYFRKAEALRHEWRWARRAADALKAALIEGRPEALPDVLAGAAPYLGAIHVPSTAAIDEDRYAGAYYGLLRRHRAEANA